MEIIEAGRAIEGGSICGQSRKPLVIARGKKRHNGGDYYRFVARFDVYSSVTSALADGINRIEPNASTSVSDELICEKAIIHSVKNRYQQSVGMGSSSHQTNHWSFPQQTAARIDVPHQSLENARQKRTEKTIPEEPGE